MTTFLNKKKNPRRSAGGGAIHPPGIEHLKLQDDGLWLWPMVRPDNPDQVEWVLTPEPPSSDKTAEHARKQDISRVVKHILKVRALR